MSNHLKDRSLKALLTIAACTAALTAQGVPVGFEESYALAADRAAVVADLIPGTEDWYYYHCRERLDARDFETVRKVLPTWIKRHGRTGRVVEIENREALLSYGDDQERTFDFLRRRLNLSFHHQQVVPGARSDLPTRLDPTVISPATLTSRAFANHRNTVDGFTDRALPALLSTDLDDKQLHSLLRRLDRPDVNNLPAMIVRDLRRRESRGFGSLGIHRELRKAQLDELLQLQPDLRQDGNFVNAYLTRLQPGADDAWYDDPAERVAHLTRLWNFVANLSPTFNSLKAHVLYHWLRHDLMQGAPDKDRFLAYIRLPRRHGYPARAHLLRHQNRAEHVDLGQSFPTLLAQIGSDEGLVRDCLEHFFATEDSVDAYSDYLDANWLKRVLAETRLLKGDGDMERWYSLLGDPGYLEQLEQRVELSFPPTQPQRYGADDAVRIELDTKNVPALLVKVFAIDAYRYHIEKQKEVDATIELDGVVANFERTYEYEEPAMRRVRRTFDLPMLRDPGTYVVEFVGNGISSRAVIHKGALRMVERTGAAGHVVRVYDERGRHVRGATAHFGGVEYPADEQGDILLPFSTDPGEKKLVLRHGDRSSLVPFAHAAERYELSNHVHVDGEALIAGNTARMVVRPQLRLTDQPVSLQLVEEPVLTIVATDLDGLATTQEVRDATFSDQAEFTHSFRVPQRLASLQVTLTCKVKGLDGKPQTLSTAPQTFHVNGIDRTAETSTPLLMRTDAGYVVELRGKNGELQAGRVCHLRMSHRDYRDQIHVELQTDADGRIQLGPLAGIRDVTVTKDGASGGTFHLDDARCRLPRVLHGRAGETLRVPYLGERAAPTRAEFSLLGSAEDAFEHLAIADGFVELRDLAPGDYSLRLHERGQHVLVRVTAGERDGQWLIGESRVLSGSRTRPLHVPEVNVEGDELRIRVANASEGTRVHVGASRYMPAFDLFDELRGDAGRRAVAVDQEPARSSYHAGRKLSDEYRYVLDRRYASKYPGNMLERPSLLLNPLALDQDSWNQAIGLGGGAGGKFGGRAARSLDRDQGAGGPSTGGPMANAGVHANLDFLPRGSALLCNLTVDADGFVRVPLADLGDGQQLHVLAIDGSQAVYGTATRGERKLTPRARTLPQSLATDRHFVQQKGIEFVAAGETAALDDARSAQVEVHDSLASVYRLFATISQDPSLQQFAFVVDWPALEPERKLELYSQHACHELHFFLRQKDRPFFDEVVAPFLANKLDKSFLDEWLLDMDVSRYLEPWRFARLNLVEKILLAQRVGDGERRAVARTLREALELRPIAPASLEHLLELALRSKELSDEAPPAMKPAPELALEPNEQPAPSRAPGAVAGGRGGLVEKGAAESRRRDRSNEDKKAESEVFEGQADAAEREEDQEALGTQTGSDDFFLGDVRKRKSVRNLYRAVDKTRLLVEHNWWHRRMENPTTDVVPANHFWIDYATADLAAPFVSSSLVEATGSFLEMMLALSVLDLPFEAGEHEVTTDGDRRTIKAATPLLLVRKEVQDADEAADTEPLLVGENFFRLDDRYRYVDGQRRDAFVTEEFLVDTAYGCQVVVTNPTSAQRTADLLLQIPAGAVPLQGGFWTKGVSTQLAPYATQTIEYSFYFPGTGSFSHYPVHAAEKGRLAAHADAQTMQVVESPTKVDTTSWQHVSQLGTPREVIDFLDTHNVQRLDLDKIAWRMRDREFFRTALATLRERHVYHGTLWSYALLHRDAAATREFLRHSDGFLSQCGTWLDSQLVDIDPKERLRFQHLELSPLVHQRAHQLGSQRRFGNQDLARQYAAFMDLLSYHPQLDDKDWLAVTYYFLLQDRVDEALQSFAKIDPNAIPTKVQYDYLSAYLCFFTGDLQKARRIAEQRRDHPVAHWRTRFRTVLTHLDEAEGKARPATDDQDPEMLAATAPAIELAVEGHDVAISYKNLQQCEVRYYELDVEFAFSAQPFAGPDGASAAYVRPNQQRTLDLPDGQQQVKFELPQQFWQKNLLVEVRAGGLVRSRQYFANALDVQFLESYGQVAVREPGGDKPLAKTYVKVFAKLANGVVRFHKDGYTDVRGRFDYASLSDDPNRGAVRYAVLVLDEQRGAVIREIRPPAR